MFIYTVKAVSIKLYLSLAVSVMAIFLVVLAVPKSDAVQALAEPEEVKPVSQAETKNVKTNEDRLNFLTRMGWEAESEPNRIEEVEIPAEFDAVLSEYNAIQIAQGMNLEKYKGKSVLLYTYRIKNFEYDGSVYAHLYLYRDRVIGGDISSAKQNGFIQGLKK